MLSTENLGYRYQDDAEFALQDINFDISQGQVVGILGANGSGKSTLFMSLLGLLKPSAGTVQFNDSPLAYDKESLMRLRRQVSMVFQDPDQQIFYSDIDSDLAFALRNIGIDEAEISRRIDRALTLVDAQHFRQKPIQYLSYGQKKRIAIASALVMQGECLLLDEPTAGLDPAGRQKIIEIIQRISAQGTRVAISSHDIDLIYQVCDYLYVLHHGRILISGSEQAVCLQTSLMQQANLAQPWLVKLHLQLGIPLFKSEKQLFSAFEQHQFALPTLHNSNREG